jgi:hypothetical protein
MTDQLADALLTRYLLGACSEDEKVRVEDRMFADDSVYLRLRDLEEQLIDRHLRGDLTGTELAQFQEAYASPSRRQRVVFAQSLQKVLSSQTPPPAAVPTQSFWDAVRASFGVRLAFAGAALALIAVLVVWRVDRRELQSSLARVEADNQALRQERALGRQRVEELEKRTAALDEKLNRPSSRPVIATFVLSPGLLRAGRAATRLTIAPGVAEVRLQLDLEPGIDHARFRVELRTNDSRVLWSQDSRPQTIVESGAAVVVTIPAALFASGEYEVVLLGAISGGGFEDAGHYYFDVIKK